MRIAVLDSATLGDDISFDEFRQIGDVDIYDMTPADLVSERIKGSDVVVVNKLKLNRSNLENSGIKLICVAATGFDNIDVDYCRENGIGVCNVVGYSTDCVAQVTVAMVLSLVNHLPEYNRCVEDGSYTASGVQNRLVPVYHELSGKTWGIVGAGNIGGKVAEVARAFGCRVIVYKRTPDERYECTDLDTLMSQADIISVHLPLSDATRNIIDSRRISLMKKDAIIVNVARGAVWDESAVSEAVEKGRIAGMGCDVYSAEPMSSDHPFNKIMHLDNVCLTPHMAWGSYESRSRCISTMAKNIKCYFNGEIYNRVDV